ncbi:galactosylceramide sulfotransferase-like [Oculina patagonica]
MPLCNIGQLEAAANTIRSGISTNQSRIGKCSPIQQVLFLKTHKTGSTTVANIFFRYGDSRDLSYVLGQDTLIGWPRRFQVSFALPFDGPQPHFLCSHTRYNKKPMNYLFPKTTSKYVTILRNPVDQFESVFNYMGLGDIYGFGRDPRKSLQEFLTKGIEFKDVFKEDAARLVRNPMLFDLGLAYKLHQNVTAIEEYLAFLDKEFDLIMNTDYFDESVVLLKRLLCWELDDVLYFKSNERQDKERAVDLSEDVKENIKRWNAADQLLFDYFNRTFWQKIKMEGEGFYDDLAAFRQKKEQIRHLCLSNGTSLQLQYGHKYVKGASLKHNLSAQTLQYCERMARSENSYLEYLRRKISMRLAALRAAAANERNEEMTSWDVASGLKYTPV